MDGVRHTAQASRNKRPATRWQPALLTRHLANLMFGTLVTKAVLHMPTKHRKRAETAVSMLSGRANCSTRKSSWSTAVYHCGSYITQSLLPSKRAHLIQSPVYTVTFFSFLLNVYSLICLQFGSKTAARSPATEAVPLRKASTVAAWTSRHPMFVPRWQPLREKKGSTTSGLSKQSRRENFSA